jgi:hypothetical protein
MRKRGNQKKLIESYAHNIKREGKMGKRVDLVVINGVEFEAIVPAALKKKLLTRS